MASAHATKTHPCLWWRIVQHPKDFPYNYNYRTWRYEIPGYWRMDYRGKDIICEKTGKPLNRRQDFPRIYQTNAAMTSIPFGQLMNYQNLLASGKVRVFEMLSADFILAQDALDVALALNLCGRTRPTHLSPSWMEGSSIHTIQPCM